MKWRDCHESDADGENSTINSKRDDAAASMCMPLK